MNDFNQSLEGAVNIDDEVFFGPITEKEKKIREQFENCISSNKANVDSLQVAENESSINDSLYKSFPAEDSKYDSFEDSLNEDVGEKLQATKHITLRKSFDKLKAKRHTFYDSLEDVCSLISNIDKCSISCGVENDSNISEKQHVIEDSLKIPPVVATNKSNGVNEKIHFDDDSLAIAEFENTFDDSLEDINMISSIESIEIEELNDLENVEAENVVVSSNVGQKQSLVSRNLFDTIDVIYEKNNFVKTDLDESFGNKNKLFDSLSNSECKDAFKDSLEESENGVAKLSSLNSESNLSIRESKIIEKNELDMSVQIIYESIKNTSVTENTSNSECIDVSKDSLENLKNVNFSTLEQPAVETVDIGSFKISKSAIPNQEKVHSEKSMLDASVQILYEKCKSDPYDEGITIPKCDVSMDNKDNLKNASSCSVEESLVVDNHIVDAANYSSSSNFTDKLVSSCQNDTGHLSKKAMRCNSGANQLCKVFTDNSVISNDNPMSVVDNSNSKTETITIDASQLKFLNDNLTLDKDLKLQFQIEVTVGNKTCKIEPENIKIIPYLNSKECQKVISLSDSAKSGSMNHEEKAEVVLDDGSKTRLGEKENRKKDIPLNDVVPNKIISSEANIIHGMKDSLPNPFKDFKMESNKSETSLLQALDLHDVSSIFNNSIIQSNDSLLPLNLSFESKPQSSMLRDESKENFPELCSSAYPSHKQYPCPSHSEVSPYKINENKTPTSFKDCSGSKENSAKRIGGTRIPVRKIDKFVIPMFSDHKIKQAPVSTEKEKKCAHSPHSTGLGKKTTGATPHKHHFCKVRNTIFSKVPQIVPSKKYMNVQSPVAQYIRNAQACSSVKSPVLEPVLRDCMNDIRFHQQLESPYHPHTLPKGGFSKLTNKKI